MSENIRGNRNLSSYQLVHLTKMLSNKFNSLLVCDGVGMGKTISAAYAVFYQIAIERKPVLIVCPAALVEKWRLELENRFEIFLNVIDSQESLQTMISEIKPKVYRKESMAYVISNSQLVKKDLNCSFGLLIIDEVHSIRNKKTKLHQKVKLIAQKCKYRIGLSATPINNSLEDLIAIFHALNPNFSYTVWDSIISQIWISKKTEKIAPITTRFKKTDFSDQFTLRRIENRSFSFDPIYEK